MKLGDQLAAIQKSKQKAFISNKISVFQFKKLLGCETALNWLHEGLSLSDIYNKCDFILTNYAGDPVIYDTVRRVAYLNILKICN